MSELRCPNCGEIFEMDESNYQQLVKQVRDNEFEEELKRRKKLKQQMKIRLHWKN